MIAYLRGTPYALADKLIVDVNGVGYGVFAGKKLLLSAVEQAEVEIHVYTHVREDRIELYGFEQQEQLKLFEMLIDVSGIGPKTALDIVDQDSSLIVDAVQNAKTSFFSAIPRIGKKTAQKIILELKSKLGSLKDLDLGPRSQKELDVIEALSALGFVEQDIRQALEKIDLEKNELEEAVKKAIKQMT